MGGFYELTDSELLNLLKQDELGAFKELYGRYWKKLYGEVYKRLKSKESAEELVQEIFTNLWLKRHTLKITETVGGYLYSTLTNRVIDLYRKELVKAKYQVLPKMRSCCGN
jgi:RNA polymerase sigma factor (sigma-70 family)